MTIDYNTNSDKKPIKGKNPIRNGSTKIKISLGRSVSSDETSTTFNNT